MPRSVGARIPFWATTNLLAQRVRKEGAVIVNRASPGRELAHRTDAVADEKFLQRLVGNRRYSWDAILLSGGATT